MKSTVANFAVNNFFSNANIAVSGSHIKILEKFNIGEVKEKKSHFACEGSSVYFSCNYGGYLLVATREDMKAERN